MTKTRIILSKVAEVNWNGTCKCGGSLCIDSMGLSIPETDLVLYLHCTSCDRRQIQTFCPMFTRTDLSKMEV